MPIGMNTYTHAHTQCVVKSLHIELDSLKQLPINVEKEMKMFCGSKYKLSC